MTMRVAVAVSGRGSNLEALLRALRGRAPARVVLVLTNRPEAGGLAHARAHSVPTEVLSNPADGADWLARLTHHRVDLLVLAGYLKLVPPAVIARYRHRIVNVHPALLPAFGGRGMYGHHVHEAVLASGAREGEAARLRPVGQHQHYPRGRPSRQGLQQRLEVAAASRDRHGHAHRHGRGK